MEERRTGSLLVVVDGALFAPARAGSELDIVAVRALFDGSR